MKRFIFCFVLFAASVQLAQINKLLLADSLYKAGEIEKAIAEYKKEYLKDNNSPETITGLALSFSRGRQADSSFKYLDLSFSKDSSIYVLSEPAYMPLRVNKRWKDFSQKVINAVNKKANIKNVNLSLQLLDMRAVDQSLYYEINIIEKKLGAKSPVYRTMWDLKNERNKKLVEELEDIIKTSGWPKISEVGEEAASAAFLVIQHSSLEKQIKYLPVIKQFCETGEAQWQSYALMYDRIQMYENKPQLYGSQTKYNKSTQKYEVYTIEDEKNVDIRRKKMGLAPIADYLLMMGIKYTAPEK